MNLTNAAQDLLDRMCKIKPEKRAYWHELATDIAKVQGSQNVKKSHVEAAIMAASPEFVQWSSS